MQLWNERLTEIWTIAKEAAIEIILSFQRDSSLHEKSTEYRQQGDWQISGWNVNSWRSIKFDVDCDVCLNGQTSRNLIDVPNTARIAIDFQRTYDLLIRVAVTKLNRFKMFCAKPDKSTQVEMNNKSCRDYSVSVGKMVSRCVFRLYSTVDRLFGLTVVFWPWILMNNQNTRKDIIFGVGKIKRLQVA